MSRREPPWWAELVLAALYVYTTWATANSGSARLGPALWYNLHLIALGARRTAIRAEQYAHRKYLESVMH